MSSQKSLRDLNGKWLMNKKLSSDVSPKDDSEILIDQSTTASIPAIKEEWHPKDYSWRENGDKLMGKVKSRSRWTKVSDLQESPAFLTEGLDGGEEVLEAEVRALEGTEWRAVQVWRMEEGRFVRRVVTSGKDEKRAETKLVYFFEGS